MHYTDQAQFDYNHFNIVIYKHADWTTRQKSTIDYELTSVQSCQYISPKLIRSIMDEIHSFRKTRKFKKDSPLNQLNALNTESFYLVKIKQVNFDGYVIESIVDATHDNINPFLKLH